MAPRTSTKAPAKINQSEDDSNSQDASQDTVLAFGKMTKAFGDQMKKKAGGIACAHSV